MNEEEKHEE